MEVINHPERFSNRPTYAMHQNPRQSPPPQHVDPGFGIIPQPIHETLEWLISAEEFTASRALIQVISKAVSPEDPAASDYLASALTRSKSYHEAVRQALHTLDLLPDSVEAMFNASKCLGNAAVPEKAEALMARVVAARPDWIDPKIDLAVYIGAQGRLEEAKAMLEMLLDQIPPDNPNLDVVKFNLGWHYIRTGDFKKGMKLLVIGRKLRIWGARSSQYPRPILTPGMDVRGKTILLCGEGGAGDEMINVRFAQTIQERGGKCQWLPQPALASLMSRARGISKVISRPVSLLGGYDYWAPAMDLPHILQIDVPEIPTTPYLSACPEYIRKWQQIFSDLETHDRRLSKKRFGKRRLRVGLRWQGNALYEQDLHRAVPFEMLESLADIDGVDFYSLQRDDGSEKITPASPVIDLGPRLETWDDTAAALHHLDLIISSCTSVPHLSGAMGKTTWILIPMSSYYLWAIPGNTSPWYPSVRLFRQPKLHDWTSPLRNVREALQKWVADRSV